MGFKFRSHELLPDAVRRVACELIDTARSDLQKSSAEHPETVHRARKCCKKLRALIRLVKPCLGEAHAVENTRIQAIARRLSSVRDADVMIAQVESLAECYPEEVQGGKLDPIREALVRRRSALADTDHRLTECLAETVSALHEAREAVAGWNLADLDAAAVAKGYHRAYRKGRKIMTACADQPTDEHVHEWRKQVKHHWYQTRLLRESRPRWMVRRSSGLRELSELLGDYHDLSVLEAHVGMRPEAYGGNALVAELMALAERRKAELLNDALKLAVELYREPPGFLGRRIERAWAAEAVLA